MSLNKNEKNIWIGFDIVTAEGPCPLPIQIKFWKDNQYKNTKPEAPFHYKADAIAGLSLVHLNPHLQSPFSSPQMNFAMANQYWLGLDPHHEMYSRTQIRIKSLQSHLKFQITPDLTTFEKSFSEILDNAVKREGIDLQQLTHLIDAIDFYEMKSGQPLMFNFSMKFSRETVKKLHYLYALLFHIRTLVAMDHNAFIHDPTHESIKVDSITDYLGKADYVANDAAFYWSFKKSREKMNETVYQHMHEKFHKFTSHACALVDNLPKSFLNEVPSEHLEDTLYLTQMDWLLGTEAGLLFRVREELYGLQEGYEKIFWPELQGAKLQSGQTLSVNCLITEKDVYPDLTEAA